MPELSLHLFLVGHHVDMTVSKLGAFNSWVDLVVAYLEKVELHFKANMIQDDSKVAVFLTVIGASNYAYVAAEPPGNGSQ